MSFNLGDLSFDEMPEDDRPVDTSGKPHPTRAWAKCKDGNDIPIHISFKGIQDPPPTRLRAEPDKVRVYRLVIEGGWGRVIDQVHTIAIDNFTEDIVLEMGDENDSASDKDTVYRILQNIKWHHLGDDHRLPTAVIRKDP